VGTVVVVLRAGTVVSVGSASTRTVSVLLELALVLVPVVRWSLSTFRSAEQRSEGDGDQHQRPFGL